jgi:D-sedoheptulose 7-phosphate isomerase
MENLKEGLEGLEGLKEGSREILRDLIARRADLADAPIAEAVKRVTSCYRDGHKLLVCGNGGSAADALHIVGELMKGFRLRRGLPPGKQAEIRRLFPEDAEYFIEHLQAPLRAISLVGEAALISAYANDAAADLVFAQQVIGHGQEGDILLAISTSGNSRNVVYAARAARLQKMTILALTGEGGGKLSECADLVLRAPSTVTERIQEYHLSIYHALCAAVENEMFSR